MNKGTRIIELEKVPMSKIIKAIKPRTTLKKKQAKIQN
jgi:hypothetical protein